MLSPLVHCTCWSIHMYNTYICLQYTCIYIYMIYGDSRNQLLLKLRVKWNTPAQGCKFRTTNLGHIWLFFLENIWLRVTKHQCSTQVLSPGKYGSLKSDDIYVLCICNIYIYSYLVYIYIFHLLIRLFFNVDGFVVIISLSFPAAWRSWKIMSCFGWRFGIPASEFQRVIQNQQLITWFFVASSTAIKSQNLLLFFSRCS